MIDTIAALLSVCSDEAEAGLKKLRVTSHEQPRSAKLREALSVSEQMTALIDRALDLSRVLQGIRDSTSDELHLYDKGFVRVRSTEELIQGLQMGMRIVVVSGFDEHGTPKRMRFLHNLNQEQKSIAAL